MTRLVVYLALSLVLALGAAWLIALPGTVRIDVGNYRLEPGIGTAIGALIALMVLTIIAWAIVRRILAAPKTIARHTARRRYDAGVEALSDGLIALQAGELTKARSLARDARSKLPENAAAQLLEARAELALGDLAAAREHYRALISNPKTAIAALAGLHEQAVAQNRPNAALTFARKALVLSPSLDWAGQAVFEDLAAKGAWAEALDMSGSLPAHTRAQRADKKRRQGILQTALAGTLEETAPDAALEHSLGALKSIPNFPPAALIAARIYINRGDTRRASGILRRVWRATGHPDVATLYAHVKPGASAVERLKRIRALVEAPGEDRAAAMVLARAAIDAYEWALARNTLAPFAANEPTQQICLLMAEIEEGQSGDQGKAREWLARAVNAPRDPTWTADGTTSDEWAPVSPVTGRLDAFEWKVPVTAHTHRALETHRPANQPDPTEPSKSIEAAPKGERTLSASASTG
ncbi:heme biosynthesis protein HemY [Pelagibacterium xiamenense]|uniref:heme biosynthesis protein HemY n=1 Tax=Pelagibacterium xiamenense TaxID=2901140 RepID=UPI001E411E97|nr:heme biosynthesis HemY N-terminal domain-containing protein [Pelagibacterium xiamenense]MCD7058316.1 heme biosynthesis protein HemY [Pelagibacterium xiamenense]